MRFTPTAFVTTIVLMASVAAATAQPLGTFTWQLRPYCNRVTVTVAQNGAVFTLDGVDDQCGAARRLPVVGMATPNADGTIEFGLSMVAANGLPAHIWARAVLPSGSGAWSDNGAHSGVFELNGSTPGPARPDPVPAPLAFVTASPTSDNTSVGANSLPATSTGTGNTATGRLSLAANQSGSNNTASGVAALLRNTVGNYNTAAGHGALALNVSGSQNTALGAWTLFDNTSGNDNTAVGNRALTHNIAGALNTAVGHRSMEFTASASESTVLGAWTLTDRAGSNNTVVGTYAMSYPGGTGTGNTALGHSALRAFGDGDDNLAVGSGAGGLLIDGSSNLYLQSPGAASESFTTRIGGAQTRAFLAGVRAAQTGVNDAVPVVIDSSGQLGTVSSSRTGKDDIEDLGDVARSISRLRPVQFRYKQPFADGTTPLQYGLIAEEVAEVLPGLVARGQDGRIDTVKYHVLPALLLSEVQRLERDRTMLSDVVAAQAAAIAELQGAVAQLRPQPPR